jgi:hypothetical protein
MENNEQELREFMRLKHHSHELKNQQLGKFPLFRDQGVGGSNPLSPTNPLPMSRVAHRAISAISKQTHPTHLNCTSSETHPPKSAYAKKKMSRQSSPATAVGAGDQCHRVTPILHLMFDRPRLFSTILLFF